MTARRIVTLLLCCLFLNGLNEGTSYSDPAVRQPKELDAQKEYRRVREARLKKNDSIVRLFKKAEVNYPPHSVFLRVFKHEDQLELWARSAATETFKWVKTYEVCMKSGNVGPKRNQGDSQVPEGVYHIDRYNPVSSFHLSLGLNYPNRSDRLRGGRNPGGDIFIHGDCVTIGCLPITDTQIEELYLIALDTHQHQKKIPVHIFPMRLNEDGMSQLKTYSKEYDKALWPFWKQLKPIYDAFEANRLSPKVKVVEKGN